MTKYTVTIRDKWEDDLDGITNADSFNQFAGITYKGFIKVTSGSFEGGYQGFAGGELVIFLPEEIASVTEETYDEDMDALQEKNEILTIQLEMAKKRIAELEAKAASDSWKGEVDRQGGQFTEEEMNRNNW